MIIRTEVEADHAAVAQILEVAFADAGESRLVTRLRSNAQPLISLVAEQDAQLIGHILFSPVTLQTESALRLMGLAPMAVLPDYQRRGIGTALVEAGLNHCRRTQIGAVVVLGHPDYYPKFGFSAASNFGIDSEYDVPADVFMLLELERGYLDGYAGTAKYHEEFSKL